MNFLDPNNPGLLAAQQVPAKKHKAGDPPTLAPAAVTAADKVLLNFVQNAVQQVFNAQASLMGAIGVARDATGGPWAQVRAQQLVDGARYNAGLVEVLDGRLTSLLAAGGLSSAVRRWTETSCVTKFFAHAASEFHDTALTWVVETQSPVDPSPVIIDYPSDWPLDAPPSDPSPPVSPTTPTAPEPEYPEPFPDTYPATPWSPGGGDVFPGTPPIGSTPSGK